MFAAIAVLGFTFANAQDGGGEGYANGDVFISGTVGFGSTTFPGDDNSASGLAFSPSVGFFVSENIALGARIGLENAKTETAGIESKDNTFSAGAFGRYYFTPGSKFSVMAELAFNYNSTSAEVAGVDAGAINGFDLAVGPGLSYFLNSNFAIEGIWGALTYETAKPDAEGAEATSSFGLGADFTDITLGLVYKF